MKKLATSLCLIFLSACASLSEYDAQNKTLLIGQIVHTGNGYPSPGTLNGVHTSKIDVSLLNLETKQTTKVTSNNYGFFSSTKLPEGKYQVSRLYCTVHNSNSNVASEWALPKIYLNIQNDKVNNIGKIFWNSTTGNKSNYSYNDNYAEPISYLQDNYQKSGWLLKEILNTKMSE